MNKKILLVTTLFTFIISIVLIVFSIYSIQRTVDINLDVVKTQQEKLLDVTSDSIDSNLGLMVSNVDYYALELSQQKISKTEFAHELYDDKRIINGMVLGLSLITLNHSNQNTQYWQFQNKKLVSTNYRQHVKPDKDWNQLFSKQKYYWSQPYYDKILQQYVISYAKPIYANDNKTLTSIIILDIDLKSIINQVADNIGEKFTTIVTNSGDYIYDIDTDKIVIHRNVKNSNSIDAKVFTLAQNPVCSELCHNKIYQDNIDHYVLYKHLSNVPWIIFSKYSNSELKSLIRSTPNSAIMLRIGGGVLMIISIILSVLILTSKRRTFARNLWIASASISMICLLGLVYTWNISKGLSFVDDSSAIISNTKLLNELQKYKNDAKLRSKTEILEIPTALQITSIEFLTAYNVQLTGSIMQIYPKDYNVNDGLKFNNSYDTKFTKVSELNSTFHHTIIWTFQTKIRENFDYKHYPFSHAKIWLSMSPFNSESNIIFTPNFSYYNGLTDVRANYGVAENVIIPGWNIQGSFFDYIDDSSRMMNEVDAYDSINLPALSFNMKINSSISDAIVTTIIPPMIIISILFVLLLTIRKSKNRFIEFKVAGIISACGGMLFTIVFTHVSLRNKITSEMMYIEYIYLVMYIVVLFIPINALLFANAKLKLIKYGNNILFKVMFLPILMSFIFIMTLVSFG